MCAGLANWLQGAALAVVGLAGLFIAAKGETNEPYVFGLTMFAIALVAMIALVRSALAAADAKENCH